MMNANVTDLQTQLERVCAERDALKLAALTYYVHYCQDEAGDGGDIVTGCSRQQMDDARALADALGLDWRKAYGEHTIRAALGDS